MSYLRVRNNRQSRPAQILLPRLRFVFEPRTNYLSKISFDIFLERVDYAQKTGIFWFDVGQCKGTTNDVTDISRVCILYVFLEEKFIKILEMFTNSLTLRQ